MNLFELVANTSLPSAIFGLSTGFSDQVFLLKEGNVVLMICVLHNKNRIALQVVLLGLHLCKTKFKIKKTISDYVLFSYCSKINTDSFSSLATATLHSITFSGGQCRAVSEQSFERVGF